MKFVIFNAFYAVWAIFESYLEIARSKMREKELRCSIFDPNFACFCNFSLFSLFSFFLRLSSESDELESESESESDPDEDEPDEELLYSARAIISSYFFSRSISFGAFYRKALRSSVSAPRPIEVK